MVAQIQKHQPAVIALAMHPAGKPHGLAPVLGAQLVAGMGAIGVHGVLRFLKMTFFF